MMCPRWVSTVRTEMKRFRRSPGWCSPARATADVALPLRQRLQRRQPIRHHQLGPQIRVDVPLAGRHLPDGIDQFLVGCALGDIPGGARRQRLPHRARRGLRETTSTLDRGETFASSGIASWPLVPGSSRSSRTKSGCSARALLTACAAVAASPTGVMSRSSSSRQRRPARNSAWSSTIRTLIIAGSCQPPRWRACRPPHGAPAPGRRRTAGQPAAQAQTQPAALHIPLSRPRPRRRRRRSASRSQAMRLPPHGCAVRLPQPRWRAGCAGGSATPSPAAEPAAAGRW